MSIHKKNDNIIYINLETRSMQKMKKENGITLIALAVTVIILMILVGTGVTAVYTGINEVKDNKLQTELGIVRQAIQEQYALAEAVQKTKVLASEPQVSFWAGDRVYPTDPIYIPTNDYIDPEDKNGQIFIDKVTNRVTPTYQEEFYYRLNAEQLKEIGVGNKTVMKGEEETEVGVSKYTYIVNYSTGEVYNESKKVTSTHHLLYLPSTVFPTASNSEEEGRFQDWN